MDLPVQLECLTEAIYFEARSESQAGKLAVANVIMNRVRDRRWPDTVCEVVHQPWQFSYYFDGKPEIYRDEKSRQMAMQVAELVFFETMLDFTEGSLYYHATRVLPDWDYSKIDRVMTLDNHVFYRDAQ